MENLTTSPVAATDGAYYGKGHQYSSHIGASASIAEMESETNSRPR